MNTLRQPDVDSGVKILLLLGCISFIGCSVAYLEDRFDHDNLGGSLRISEVAIVESDKVVFELSKEELGQLENEIGRMSWSETTAGERNEFLKSTEKELWFTFSDGFKIKVDYEFGTINEVCVLRIGLPDEGGFGGDIPIFVNMNDVLDRNRLDEVKNVLGTESSGESTE